MEQFKKGTILSNGVECVKIVRVGEKYVFLFMECYGGGATPYDYNTMLRIIKEDLERLDLLESKLAIYADIKDEK